MKCCIIIGMNKSKGFTLIEVIVVLIILGVLAAMAIPVYFSWINRSKVMEAYVIIGQGLKEVMACYIAKGEMNQCFQSEYNSGNFHYYPPGALLPGNCVRFMAKNLQGATPTKITCLCKGTPFIAIVSNSAIGRIIDLDSGDISNCTISGGDYEGM